jgi:hypothetical protein
VTDALSAAQVYIGFADIAIAAPAIAAVAAGVG